MCRVCFIISVDRATEQRLTNEKCVCACVGIAYVTVRVLPSKPFLSTSLRAEVTQVERSQTVVLFRVRAFWGGGAQHCAVGVCGRHKHRILDADRLVVQNTGTRVRSTAVAALHPTSFQFCFFEKISLTQTMHGGLGG